MRDRGSWLSEQTDKSRTVGVGVRVGRTIRIIIVTRVILLIWGASARKIDDQEAPAMLIRRVVDTVPEEVDKLFPSSPRSFGKGIVGDWLVCSRKDHHSQENALDLTSAAYIRTQPYHFP